jgi:uncharacterized phage protein (TIGR01671 family)
MDREIKFRAWDSVHNRMIYLKDCVSFGHIDEFDVYELYFEENGLKCRVYKEYDDDFGGGIADETDLAIMQYTGLKDKNGVEVYEGDKVMFDYEWTKPDEIGVITWNKDTASFQIKGHIPSSSMKHLDRMKVIGNIYENKVD